MIHSVCAASSGVSAPLAADAAARCRPPPQPPETKKRNPTKPVQDKRLGDQQRLLAEQQSQTSRLMDQLARKESVRARKEPGGLAACRCGGCRMRWQKQRRRPLAAVPSPHAHPPEHPQNPLSDETPRTRAPGAARDAGRAGEHDRPAVCGAPGGAVRGAGGGAGQGGSRDGAAPGARPEGRERLLAASAAVPQRGAGDRFLAAAVGR
jgi:hypothetical protein